MGNAMKKLAILALAAIALTSCTKAQDKTPYNTSFAVKEIMGHVIDPAAQTYWHASGYHITAEGSTNLRPTTEEGWLAAESGAVQVAEAGNLLMLPGRRRDDGEWIKFAQALNKAGLDALEATEARDDDRMFDTGGKIYEVCTGCHQKYLLPFLGPDGEPVKGGPLDSGAK